jgi:hypothetical protein
LNAASIARSCWRRVFLAAPAPKRPESAPAPSPAAIAGSAIYITITNAIGWRLVGAAANVTLFEPGTKV